MGNLISKVKKSSIVSLAVVLMICLTIGLFVNYAFIPLGIANGEDPGWHSEGDEDPGWHSEGDEDPGWHSEGDEDPGWHSEGDEDPGWHSEGDEDPGWHS